MTGEKAAAGRPWRRLGPRPLALHLQQAALVWGTAPLAGEPLRAALAAEPAGEASLAALREELTALPPGALARRLSRAAGRRHAAFLAGLQAYWRHHYRRALAEPPVLWARGAARLLDYGPAGGVPLLVVPSLVNRAYILDLGTKRSLLRWLARRGLRPLLLDWGEPGPMERDLGLDGYIAGHLDAALDVVLALGAGRPPVLGYCMGGLLAVALAQRRAADVAGLALLATPWDFHTGDLDPLVFRARLALPATALALLVGELPVVALQALFAAVDPLQVPRKFVRFAALAPDSEQAALFVAIEDWANDGVPLTVKVAHECLLGWYGDNLPARGAWRIGGQPVRPERLRLPSLAAVPSRDRIVPPASALALARALPSAEVIRPASGHVGMVAGAGAEARLWRPLERWLRRIAALRERRSSGTAA